MSQPELNFEETFGEEGFSEEEVGLAVQDKRGFRAAQLDRRLEPG